MWFFYPDRTFKLLSEQSFSLVLFKWCSNQWFKSQVIDPYLSDGTTAVEKRADVE